MYAPRPQLYQPNQTFPPQDPLKEALLIYKGLFEDLSRRRAHEINETSAMRK